MTASRTRTKASTGLKVERVWTTEGVHPYDEVTWERRDVVMTNWRDGSINFEQRGVEFPESWSVNAANIVTTKYFRGAVGTPEREWSLRQLIDRVVSTYRAAGEEHGYFATPADAEVFAQELTWMLLHQVFSFNSPVWFNVGTPSPQQVSACLPYDSLVSTPGGLVPIGKLVEENAVGAKVYDGGGLTRIVAVKANGVREVIRLHTKAGYQLDVTPDHVVWKSTGDGTGQWVEAGTLAPGDKLEWHRTYAYGESEIDLREIREAALAGWLQSDGFVGQYDEGTNRSLTIEAMTVNDDELDWVAVTLDEVFGDAHRHERTVTTQSDELDCRRTRLYGEHLRPFVQKWDLLTRGVEMEVPRQLFTAPLPVVAAYLRSIFQAEGYVSAREHSTLVAVDMVSEKLIRGVQSLLLRFGIFSRVAHKPDPRSNRKDCWSVRIQNDGDRDLFATHIGFVGAEKMAKLEQSFAKAGRSAGGVKRLEIDRIEPLGAMEVYDIQTESGEFLAGNLRVHNCFILSVDDSMDSILDWYKEEGLIFKGGSGSGVNLSRIRSSRELLSSGGTASGPVSFMRGADASAGTIKSGGATRRAAKMVILDVDHPDIEEFVITKAREEDKIRALRDAGFDMDLGGNDIVSVQYQNANNSVRVSDEFMSAVENGGGFDLRGRLDGQTIETIDAKKLFRTIAQAAWECADPGLQYDDTINDWHTCPETGRITASNPCFTADTLVHTDKGLIRFDALIDRARQGETFGIYTHDATNPDAPADRIELTSPEALMITGTNEILRLEFSNGMVLRCTPNHRIWTTNRGYVEAAELTSSDRILPLNLPTPAVAASRAFAMRPGTAVRPGDVVTTKWQRESRLPEKWTEEFAHLLGWLTGDGCVRLGSEERGDNPVATWVYSAEEREAFLPRHQTLLTELLGFTPKPSEQPNGTVQLRAGRTAVVDFLVGLGVSAGKAADKRVPAAVLEAPVEIQAEFLKGLFDADGCAAETANDTRYVGLGSVSVELLRDVQRMLSCFGIGSRIYTSRTEGPSFSYTTVAGEDRSYTGGQLYDLRISGANIPTFAAAIGFAHPRKADRLADWLREKRFYRTDQTATLAKREFDGIETTYNLSEPRNHSYIANGVVVRNCSEYLHLDNSSCNLASLNLMKFLRADGGFEVEKFVRSVEFVITAMDISICFADFPTERIGETTRAYRQLGIGYANLGALLMASGLPYDSEQGRSVAAAITSLMTGTAYRRSAELAGIVGAYDGYARNAEPHKRVMRKHAAANDEIKPTGTVATAIVREATKQWTQGNKVGDKHGWRNSQAAVLAPTGTIGLMMDCDTTGVEPDLALVKFKKLVGGGSMQIVNQTVPRALRSLGYPEEQVEAIVEHIADHGHVVDAPGLKPEHYPVFDCAMGERSIAPMGHVRMMAAVQPFISGAISKCVVGETLVASGDGLVRMGSLYQGEAEDTFRTEFLKISSLDGDRKTDAFYYGGVRPVRTVTLRSGHSVTGTYPHRLLTAGDGGLVWKTLGELQPGDHVATQYGADLWSSVPASLRDVVTSRSYGNQRAVTLPQEMTEELAFLLGAYAAEGHTSRSNWTITITNSVDSVLERIQAAWQSVFGLTARIDRQPGKCPGVVLSSKSVVEFMTELGCGSRASDKRIPDAVLRSPRDMVLAFLRGLALDAYVTTATAPKWAICLDSPALLDDLQAVLTNLGVVHGRVSKFNSEYGKSYDEVYAAGYQGQLLVSMVPFLEPEKAAAAARYLAQSYGTGTADVVPGITGRELYDLLPAGRPGRGGVRGDRSSFAFLLDERTTHVTRRTVERVASLDGVVLPGWLRQVLDGNLHFSPVDSIVDAGEREVFDLSVPETHAFVANGIMNHNTVNMPEQATVEDVEKIYFEGWKLGLKALAIYRDNCKVGQPLSVAKPNKATASVEAPAEAEKAVEKVVEKVVEYRPVRKRLPKKRPSETVSFSVGGAEGYLTASSYPDDGLGEVFLKMSKQGSTLAGVMDAFSVAISIGLQYGVPLETYVSKFTNMRFEPAGMTDDPDVRMAASVMDYIFRRLALDFLPYERRAELGIFTAKERAAQLRAEAEAESATVSGADLTAMAASAPVESPETKAGPGQPATVGAVAQPAQELADVAAAKPAPSVGSSTELLEAVIGKAADAPLCFTCGTKMRPAGSCYVCEGCGSTSGCS
ncbi:LAGLIDADG family homing endonuclease [Micromonospora haikouensis]|uniref:LAGLIDADG family homing endonuclease n=1 Tax=Micromonospora haikouensis TaxID=686309 RepID=UPI00210A6AA2|nr:LAGLIDADG family homing endonuclease [Micromonospora haikouensis]